MIDESQGAFPCRSSTLTILADSGPFGALLLTVLGPRAISMIDDPRVVFTCPSSTIIILANSDLFRGLLLTALGSRSDFHGCSTPKCGYVLAINNRSFGRFWPVSWTVLADLGSLSDFHD